MTWRVVITITRSFEEDDRAYALGSLDNIIAKVPEEWEIRTQDLKHEE